MISTQKRNELSGTTTNTTNSSDKSTEPDEAKPIDSDVDNCNAHESVGQQDEENEEPEECDEEDEDDEDKEIPDEEDKSIDLSLVSTALPSHSVANISRHLNSNKVVVIEGDCLSTALLLKNRFGTNPVVLNMASMSHPGGGYRGGAGAQEGK